MHTKSVIGCASAVVGVVCATHFWRSNHTVQGQSVDRRVVASVNGDEIDYSRIRVSLEQAGATFQDSTGRETTSVDPDSIETLRLERECQRLRDAVRGRVHTQQIHRFGISVDEGEIEERLRTQFPDYDEKVAAETIRREQQLILTALEDVVVRGKDPDVVFHARLEGTVSAENWALRLRHQTTPRQLALIRRTVGLSDKELASPHDMVRSIIETETLHAAIDLDLRDTDPEYAEYNELCATDPSNPKVQEKPPTYRDAKRYEWWEQRYREAKVKILDERFKDAWPPKSGE